MESVDISIIVPVYNALASLRICIDSILLQSYTSFELILINDGSQDGSASICDEYALKDSRVRVYHQPNSGVSVARNKGLDYARGTYVTFVDADDFIDIDFLKNLFVGEKVDLIIGGYVNRVIGKGIESVCSLNDQICLEHYSVGLFLESNLDTLFLRTPWGKLFRRDLIECAGIRFNTHFFFGEDSLFVLQFLFESRTIRIESKSGYVYNYLENWQEKYQRNIQIQYASFNALVDNLMKVASIYSISVNRAIDKYVYVFGLIFQTYLYRTPWKILDRRIVRLFFSDSQVQSSLKRLGKEYKKMKLLYYLSRLDSDILFALYAKSYHRMKRFV